MTAHFWDQLKTYLLIKIEPLLTALVQIWIHKFDRGELNLQCPLYTVLRGVFSNYMTGIEMLLSQMISVVPFYFPCTIVVLHWTVKNIRVSLFCLRNWWIFQVEISRVHSIIQDSCSGRSCLEISWCPSSLQILKSQIMKDCFINKKAKWSGFHRIDFFEKKIGSET